MESIHKTCLLHLWGSPYNEEATVNFNFNGFDELAVKVLVRLELLLLVLGEDIVVFKLNIGHDTACLASLEGLEARGDDPCSFTHKMYQFLDIYSIVTLAFIVPRSQFRIFYVPGRIAGTICTPEEPLPITATTFLA